MITKIHNPIKENQPPPAAPKLNEGWELLPKLNPEDELLLLVGCCCCGCPNGFTEAVLLTAPNTESVLVLVWPPKVVGADDGWPNTELLLGAPKTFVGALLLACPKTDGAAVVDCCPNTEPALDVCPKGVAEAAAGLPNTDVCGAVGAVCPKTDPVDWFCPKMEGTAVLLAGAWLLEVPKENPELAAVVFGTELAPKLNPVLANVVLGPKANPAGCKEVDEEAGFALNTEELPAVLKTLCDDGFIKTLFVEVALVVVVNDEAAGAPKTLWLEVAGTPNTLELDLGAPNALWLEAGATKIFPGVAVVVVAVDVGLFEDAKLNPMFGVVFDDGKENPELGLEDIAAVDAEIVVFWPNEKEGCWIADADVTANKLLVLAVLVGCWKELDEEILELSAIGLPGNTVVLVGLLSPLTGPKIFAVEAKRFGGGAAELVAVGFGPKEKGVIEGGADDFSVAWLKLGGGTAGAALLVIEDAGDGLAKEKPEEAAVGCCVKPKVFFVDRLKLSEGADEGAANKLAVVVVAGVADTDDLGVKPNPEAAGTAAPLPNVVESDGVLKETLETVVAVAGIENVTFLGVILASPANELVSPATIVELVIVVAGVVEGRLKLKPKPDDFVGPLSEVVGVILKVGICVVVWIVDVVPSKGKKDMFPLAIFLKNHVECA